MRESILDRTIVTMPRAMTLEALSQTVVMNYAEQQESTMQLRASMTSIEEKFTDLYILLTKTHRNRWWTILTVVRRTAKIRYSILNWNLAVVLGLMRWEIDLHWLRIAMVWFAESNFRWIALAERHFRIGGYSEAMKVRAGFNQFEWRCVELVQQWDLKEAVSELDGL